MSPTITLTVMLVVTLGAALYVAWPLLFGSVRPEDYLVVEGPDEGTHRTRHGVDNGRVGAQQKAHRKTAVAGTRVDLDVEQEIEAFRRKAKGSSARPGITCVSCGRPLTDPDAAFCSKCGTPVPGAAGQGKKRTDRSREDR